jgi:hypothetical protein
MQKGSGQWPVDSSWFSVSGFLVVGRRCTGVEEFSVMFGEKTFRWRQSQLGE